MGWTTKYDYHFLSILWEKISYTHRIHGAAIYGAPWIPSIYPSHVSIFLPAPWIRHGIWVAYFYFWLARWFFPPWRIPGGSQEPRPIRISPLKGWFVGPSITTRNSNPRKDQHVFFVHCSSLRCSPPCFQGVQLCCIWVLFFFFFRGIHPVNLRQPWKTTMISR